MRAESEQAWIARPYWRRSSGAGAPTPSRLLENGRDREAESGQDVLTVQNVADALDDGLLARAMHDHGLRQRPGLPDEPAACRQITAHLVGNLIGCIGKRDDFGREIGRPRKEALEVVIGGDSLDAEKRHIGCDDGFPLVRQTESAIGPESLAEFMLLDKGEKRSGNPN